MMKEGRMEVRGDGKGSNQHQEDGKEVKSIKHPQQTKEVIIHCCQTYDERDRPQAQPEEGDETKHSTGSDRPQTGLKAPAYGDGRNSDAKYRGEEERLLTKNGEEEDGGQGREEGDERN
jgi:hypothetical protein